MKPRYFNLVNSDPVTVLLDNNVAIWAVELLVKNPVTVFATLEDPTDGYATPIWIDITPAVVGVPEPLAHPWRALRLHGPGAVTILQQGVR